MEFPAFFHYFARKMVEKKVPETVHMRSDDEFWNELNRDMDRL